MDVSSPASSSTPAPTTPAATPSAVTGTTTTGAKGFTPVKGTESRSLISVPKQSFAEKVQQFGTDWQGVASLLFIVLFAVVMWRTLKSMPRTKPVEIKPKANVEVSWSDIAG